MGERPKSPRIEPWILAPVLIALVALAWTAWAMLRR
jgi:hypothetical protein